MDVGLRCQCKQDQYSTSLKPVNVKAVLGTHADVLFQADFLILTLPAHSTPPWAILCQLLDLFLGLLDQYMRSNWLIPKSARVKTRLRGAPKPLSKVVSGN